MTGVAPLRLPASRISTSSGATTTATTGGGGASMAGGTNRRYSMDDFGVQIAHRAELHTSNVSTRKRQPVQPRCAAGVVRRSTRNHRFLFSRDGLLRVVGLLRRRVPFYPNVFLYYRSVTVSRAARIDR